MALEAENSVLRGEVARLKKNSSNSSKPPSSDITGPPSSGGTSCGGGRKRHIGGQEGHAKHEHPAFPPEQIDRTVQYELADPGKLVPLNQWRKLQQIELLEKPFVVTEHQARLYRDPVTGTIYKAPFPPEVARAGLCGPRLWAFIGYLKGGCRMSYALIGDLFKDVLGVTLCAGQLAKVVRKTSSALAPAYQQLLEALPRQAVLGVDETGHYDRGKTLWNWCFRAENFALFKIDPSRGSQVLAETLGLDYAGTLVCDFFSAYRKFLQATPCAMQFCLAHLIRDVKFLTTLPDAATKAYGESLRLALKELFEVIHRRESMSATAFQRSLEAARQQVLRVGMADVPATAQAQNLANRFRKHGAEYFTFVTTPGIDPTNNTAEQAIRFVVIDRRITQGTRGENGRKWSERIWTVIATCTQQGHSVLAFLKKAATNWLNGEESPSLLAETVVA
jgi:transposase